MKQEFEVKFAIGTYAYYKIDYTLARVRILGYVFEKHIARGEVSKIEETLLYEIERVSGARNTSVSPTLLFDSAEEGFAAIAREVLK